MTEHEDLEILEDVDLAEEEEEEGRRKRLLILLVLLLLLLLCVCGLFYRYTTKPAPLPEYPHRSSPHGSRNRRENQHLRAPRWDRAR